MNISLPETRSEMKKITEALNVVRYVKICSQRVDHFSAYCYLRFTFTVKHTKYKSSFPVTRLAFVNGTCVWPWNRKLRPCFVRISRWREWTDQRPRRSYAFKKSRSI